MISLWSDSTALPAFEPLKHDAKTDVLIIGGGMAGVLCAYMLEHASVDYMLVEAETIGSGTTRNTTAKITAQHSLIYHKLFQKNPQNAKLYLEANLEAAASYRQLCQKFPCDYVPSDSFVYSLNDKKVLLQEAEVLQKLGYPAEFLQEQDLPLPFSTAGAVRFPDQAQFHPLKFLSGIAKGLKIHEHTMVTKLSPHLAVTEQGVITADKIIVATHFPLLNRHGSFFLKMYQHRSYVIALENALPFNQICHGNDDVHTDCIHNSRSNTSKIHHEKMSANGMFKDEIFIDETFTDGMFVDESPKGLSFRTYGNLLLLGGGSHRTGKSGGGWDELREFAGKHYPDAKEVYHWAAQDCMTLDDVPYIGQYSANTPGLYVATGFNKWGMTSSMVAARLLTDLILGKPNPYKEVFSPSRSILTPQLAVNAFESTLNLLTPSIPRCTHLGCALKWNSQEHSWDCPCHGSRFSKDGDVIDNPARHDL